jgi:hypothetical protein
VKVELLDTRMSGEEIKEVGSLSIGSACDQVAGKIKATESRELEFGEEYAPGIAWCFVPSYVKVCESRCAPRKELDRPVQE